MGNMSAAFLNRGVVAGLAASTTLSAVRRLPATATCLTAVSVVSARHASNRPNTRRPKHPSWNRQQLIELTKPQHTLKHPTTQFLYQDCPRHREMQRKEAAMMPNDYEMIYVREMQEFLAQSKMVAVFQAQVKFKWKWHTAWQNARRAGMELRKYETVMIRAAAAGTKYEDAMAHFCNTSSTAPLHHFVFSPEVQPKKLLDLDKKMPDFLLLGVIVENRLLSKRRLQDMVKMPPIDVLRAELCAILSSPAQKTASLLSSNQQALSTNLAQYVKDQSGVDEGGNG